ncbi:hypothetical protein FGO68_gene10154 [Halteria grandinella]|uniref:Uncharacterized protein n=1 Tax=Halteria grandinella TaxID=5974 RepID=A0A8J8P5H3_HALGN|nr:hypothetical protein FGO68_gene10154 [Halteria grandinella]
MFTILVGQVRPFANQSSREAWVNIDENHFKIFNEILVTYYLIFMLLLTDITSDYELRIAMGMVELAIIGLCVLSNILKAALAGINELRRRRAEKRRRELLKLQSSVPPITIQDTSQTKTQIEDSVINCDDPPLIPMKPKKKKLIRLIIPPQMQVKVPANVTKEIVRKLSNDAAISEGYSDGMFQTPLEAYQRGLEGKRVKQVWDQDRQVIWEAESEREEDTIWKNN